MLSQITLLTSLLFAAIYPLCFWINAHDPLKKRFHHFHLSVANIIGGLILVYVLITPFPIPIKITISIWKGLLFGFTRHCWRKEFPNPLIFTGISLIGLIVYSQIHQYYFGFDSAAIMVWILGGFIFCASLFAMNLGHWYLNVHGLPISHLKRATAVFGCLLGLRLLWDVIILATKTVTIQGDFIPLIQFLGSMDGFLLNVAIIFGTIFPLAALFFVKETLRLKNTQSTTGILYVILCSVVLGDLAYKYYFIKYGITL